MPSRASTGSGAARLGRAREKNENRTKVSLYIFRPRFHEERKKLSDDLCLQENGEVAGEDGTKDGTRPFETFLTEVGGVRPVRNSRKRTAFIDVYAAHDSGCSILVTGVQSDMQFRVGHGQHLGSPDFGLGLINSDAY